jgi:hypothetical protein
MAQLRQLTLGNRTGGMDFVVNFRNRTRKVGTDIFY